MGRKPLHIFTAEEDALILDRARQGYYDRNIADELGVPLNAVVYRRQQLGLFKLKKNARIPSPEALREMEAAYAAFVEAAAAFLEQARNGRN